MPLLLGMLATGFPAVYNVLRSGVCGQDPSSAAPCELLPAFGHGGAHRREHHGGGHHTREHQRREHYRKIMAPSALCCQPRICNLGVWFWRPMSGSSQEPPSYGLAPSLSPCVGQMTSPRVLLWGAPCHFHVTAQASAPSCAFLSWAAIRSDIPQDPTGRDFSTYDANMRAQAYNVACMQTLVKSTHIHRSIRT